ncbi:hypothetical protein [Desulfobaculum bizertense]|uniref:Uncharacterized protein n=1 Tax=Desulfobaculum bizertense DSM 18034 TaxID=1121442 RepID=A0A1T4W7K3_9BACT|nr:hypothetical protein [Desulfobaculum bizertense]SKA72681.1 hypothetical protein SAMN02745702_01660 [Desulfobaculum bizertense DSM 18034]
MLDPILELLRVASAMEMLSKLKKGSEGKALCEELLGEYLKRIAQDLEGKETWAAQIKMMQAQMTEAPVEKKS